MINTDRIVPTSAIDLISLYGLILKQTSGITLTALEATNIGQFDVKSASNALLANEPLANCDIASSISSATIYFVPAYDYNGFTKNGASITQTGTVVPDGRTLYSATLADGSITIAKVGF